MEVKVNGKPYNAEMVRTMFSDVRKELADRNIEDDTGVIERCLYCTESLIHFVAGLKPIRSRK